MDQPQTAQEAADRLGTSLRCVRRLIFERSSPVVKVGRRVRIAEDDLEAFIAAGRVEPGSLPSSWQRRST